MTTPKARPSEKLSFGERSRADLGALDAEIFGVEYEGTNGTLGVDLKALKVAALSLLKNQSHSVKTSTS